jgi:hypothetical protein
MSLRDIVFLQGLDASNSHWSRLPEKGSRGDQAWRGRSSRQRNFHPWKFQEGAAPPCLRSGARGPKLASLSGRASGTIFLVLLNLDAAAGD